MQIYACQLGESDRPQAPGQCPKCKGCVRLHAHGSYERHLGSDGQAVVKVSRFICPQCRHTWSVIPAGMMPYRAMTVERSEQLVDEQLGMADGGARPPPASEVEKGCIRRALKVLSKRTPFLSGLLGQQMPWQARVDAGCFWRALRKLGPLMDILVRLARDFKTSLFGCYRSLQPHWEREKLPAPAG